MGERERGGGSTQRRGARLMTTTTDLNYANERQTVTSWPTDLSRRLDPFHMQMSSQRKCQHDTSIPASPFKALPIPQHPTASPGNLPRIFV